MTWSLVAERGGVPFNHVPMAWSWIGGPRALLAGRPGMGGGGVTRSLEARDHRLERLLGGGDDRSSATGLATIYRRRL
jgi:hypothetical protein